MKKLTLLCLGISWLSAAETQMAAVVDQQGAATLTVALPWAPTTNPDGTCLLMVDLGNGLVLRSNGTDKAEELAVKMCLASMLSDKETMAHYMAGDSFTGQTLVEKINAHYGIHEGTKTNKLPRFWVWLKNECIGFVRLGVAPQSDREYLALQGVDLTNKGLGIVAMILRKDHWKTGIAHRILKAGVEQVLPYYTVNHPARPAFGNGPLAYIMATYSPGSEATEPLLSHLEGALADDVRHVGQYSPSIKMVDGAEVPVIKNVTLISVTEGGPRFIEPPKPTDSAAAGND